MKANGSEMKADINGQQMILMTEEKPEIRTDQWRRPVWNDYWRNDPMMNR